MRFSRIVLVSVLFLGAFAPRRLSSQTGPETRGGGGAADSLLAAVDALAPRSLARHRVPSIAVAYVRDGAVAWTRVYGEQAEGVPATTETLYSVASLTKPVFAEVILRLAADGKFELDEPMAAHWVDPEVAGDPRHRVLTPRMALSHRTGLPNWRGQSCGVIGLVYV